MCNKPKFDHASKWYMHNLEPVLENDIHKLLWDFDTNGSPNLGQKTRPYNNQQKGKICKIIDAAVPADHRVNLKECEKRDKYLDLAREL